MKNEGTSIILHQRKYDTITKLVTKENDASRNITVTLPNKSGTVAYAEELAVGARVIDQPEVIEAETAGSVFKLTPYSTTEGFKGRHTSTQYVYATNNTMSNVVGYGIKKSGDLTTIAKPMVASPHFIQFRYISGKNISEWSEPVEFISNAHVMDKTDGTTDDTIDVRVHRDDTNIIYIGTVPGANCIDNRDHRGSLTYYFNSFYKVARDNMGYGNNFPFIQRDWEVLYKGKRYYSKRDQFVHASYNTLYKPAATDVSASAAVNAYSYNAGGKIWQVHDGTGKTIVWDPESEHADNPWALADGRNMLPTYRWLLWQRIGIGVGLNDNNNGGNTTGGGIGDIANEGSGWIKAIYNNKLLYIAKKPACLKVSWNDIAFRECATGKYTVRLGEKLYYIRMLKENEYRDLLIGLIDGKIKNDNPSDYGLGEFEWCHDLQEGSIVRNTVKCDLTTKTMVRGTKDPKSRDGTVVYRPVLELIPEGEEPYNNLPECHLAANRNAETINNARNDDERDSWEAIQLDTGEAFQFDKWMDTGYLGMTTSNGLTNGSNTFVKYSEIKSATGVNNVQSDTFGWFKFYWHGIIIYISVDFISIWKSTSWTAPTYTQCENLGILYGLDTCKGGIRSVTKNGIKYKIRTPSGNKTEPFRYTNEGWASSGSYSAVNSYLHMGRNTMWNELMYRIISGICGNQSASTDPGLTRNVWGGGHQLGCNWLSLVNGASGENVFPMHLYSDESENWVTGYHETGNRVTRVCDSVSSWRGDRSPSITSEGWRACLLLS